MKDLEIRLNQIRTEIIQTSGIDAASRSKRMLVAILNLYHEAANAGDLVEVKNITAAARSTILPEWAAICTGTIGGEHPAHAGAGT